MLVAVESSTDLEDANLVGRDSERWVEATSSSAATAKSWALIMVKSGRATIAVPFRRRVNICWRAKATVCGSRGTRH